MAAEGVIAFMLVYISSANFVLIVSYLLRAIRLFSLMGLKYTKKYSRDRNSHGNTYIKTYDEAVIQQVAF